MLKHRDTRGNGPHSKLAIIVPALNESKTVASVVARAKAVGNCHVYVVDDCSRDDTAALAANAGARVLPMPYTVGAWTCVQAALLYAMKQDEYDFFVTLDADEQHLPEDIPMLVNHARFHDVDLVIGSCPERGSRARKAAWALFAACTRLGVQDMTSGFRVYSRKAVESLLTREAALLDYQDMGVLLLLRRNGMRLAEVKVHMECRKDGCSRIFDSWWSVTSYMMKTGLWIISDRIRPKSAPEQDSWRKYDAI